MPAKLDRKRPDVRPGADADVERHRFARIRNDVERVHGRAAYRHRHLDATPRKLVRALTADLHRGRGRDRQLDLTTEELEPFRKLVLAGSGVTRHDLPFRIAGGGAAGEIDLGEVALVQADEAWRELSCPTGQQE